MNDKRKPPPPPGKNPFWTTDMVRPDRSRQNEAVERVAQELGASPAEAATAARETRSSMTSGEAALELGDPVAVELARARLPIAIAKLLMKFQTNLGRRLLVKLMVEELTGDEVALPADLLEEVDFMLAEDGERTPDAEPFISVAQGLLLYRHLGKELRGRGGRS